MVNLLLNCNFLFFTANLIKTDELPIEKMEREYYDLEERHNKIMGQIKCYKQEIQVFFNYIDSIHIYMLYFFKEYHEKLKSIKEALNIYATKQQSFKETIVSKINVISDKNLELGKSLFMSPGI